MFILNSLRVTVMTKTKCVAVQMSLVGIDLQESHMSATMSQWEPRPNQIRANEAGEGQ